MEILTNRINRVGSAVSVRALLLALLAVLPQVAMATILPATPLQVTEFRNSSALFNNNDRLSRFSAVDGTFDPLTGDLFVDFTLAEGGQLTIDAPGLTFDAAGTLANGVTAAVQIFPDATTPASIPAEAFSIFFAPRLFNSTRDQASNSLVTRSDGLLYLALWGAEPERLAIERNAAIAGGSVVQEFGLDLRVGITAVPIPAAFLLFGSGLLALFGMARFKRDRLQVA